MFRSLDFETVPFSPGNMAPPPVCLAWSDGIEEHVTHWTEAEPIIERLLAGPHPVAIAKAAFDMAVVCAHYPRLIPKVFDAYDRGIIKDIQIRQKLIDLTMGKLGQFGPYSLKNCVKFLADVDLDKEGSPRTDYARFRDVPVSEWPEAHIEYARKDAYWHRRCAEIQQEELEKENGLKAIADEDRQTRADFALTLASTWGIRTDPVGVEALKSASLARQAELEEELIASGLLVRDKKGALKRKVRHAQARMLETLGDYTKAKLTPKGRELKRKGGDYQEPKFLAVDAEACADSHDPLLAAYTEYAQLGTLLSGHIKAMETGTEKPIHTRFEVLLETGRTSSSSPNIQNVRRQPGARECFVPRPGCVFVGCDYDKAELHTLAQVCINIGLRSKLADALNAGFDPHTGLGATLAGVSYEEAVARVEAGDEEMTEWRQRAKPANFGFPGGMGPAGMVRYAKTAYGLEISHEESESLYEGWRTQWPGVQEYLRWISDLCSPLGYGNVEHFKSHRIRGKVPYCAAANSFFQGMAADGAKRALFEVARMCYTAPASALYGCRVVNFVHDEIIMEAPEEQADAAAWALRKIMVDEFNAFTPDVPVRATPCLMDRWSKKAKTIVDDKGRLEVWRYGSN